MRVRDAIHLRLPLHRRFRNAGIEVTEREVVLVAVTDGDLTGWGEAAPWPGEPQAPSAAEVFASVVGGAPERWAAAAIDEAEADVAARREGLVLSEHIAGRSMTPPPSLAIGLDEEPAEAARAAVAAGYATVKLKVAPGDDVERVRLALRAAPGLRVAVDGNGSYPVEQAAAVETLAEAGAAYVEQPFPRGSHDAHRRLRASLGVPLALDEDIRSVGDAQAVIASRAADILVVKPAILGLTGCRRIHDLARSGGLAVKPSGFVETSIGRAHSLALASLPASAWADAAPATAYLDVDPVRLAPGGGIGIEPDPDLIAPYVVDRGSMS